MSARSSFGQAVRHLQAADPVLARIIERIGPRRRRSKHEGTHLDALVSAIIYQQISGKAAAAIEARVEALFGGRLPTAAELAAIGEDRLRAAGLSRQKIAYLKDLARHVAAGELTLERLDDLEDAAVIEALRRVKGFGLWTAQMFLLFHLDRPDVLPATDFGIRKAVMRAYGLRSMPTPAKVERIGARWRPYASAAAWFLWRSLEVDVAEES
jgi:3-methyladenine DNA glycosylase/8-oxoguanine DNA glycosylase